MNECRKLGRPVESQRDGAGSVEAGHRGVRLLTKLHGTGRLSKAEQVSPKDR
jgi:hypothetical protein